MTDSTTDNDQRKIVSLAEDTDKASSLEVRTRTYIHTYIHIILCIYIIIYICCIMYLHE